MNILNYIFFSKNDKRKKNCCHLDSNYKMFSYKKRVYSVRIIFNVVSSVLLYVWCNDFDLFIFLCILNNCMCEFEVFCMLKKKEKIRHGITELEPWSSDSAVRVSYHNDMETCGKTECITSSIIQTIFIFENLPSKQF